MALRDAGIPTPITTLLAAVTILSAYFSAAWADDLENKSVGEIKKEMGFLNARPSADTTPLYFKAGKVKYKIPRNYIVRMFDWSMRAKNDIVTMRVTYPGFKPYSEETKDCLAKPPLYWPKGCFPVEFSIGIWRTDETASPMLTDDEMFDNARKSFHSQTPKPGPDGFEMYEAGPEDARTEYYRKKTPTHTIFIYCGLVQSDPSGTRWDDDTRKRYGPCTNDGSPLPNGGAISYGLHLYQMKDAEQIDEGLRELLLSFTIPEGKL